MRLIDADALMKEFPCACGCKHCGQGKDGILSCDIKDKIKEAPTIDRPHGKWIKGKEISRTMLGDKTLHIDYKDFTCSVCGLVLDRLIYHVDGSPFYKFCPNCGSDNRKRGEAE